MYFVEQFPVVFCRTHHSEEYFVEHLPVAEERVFCRTPPSGYLRLGDVLQK